MGDTAHRTREIRRWPARALCVAVALLCGFAALLLIGESAFLLLFRKDIHGGAVGAVNVAERPPLFDGRILARVERGEDMVPGLRATPNACARYVRAVVNSLLGSRHFQHSPMRAKLLWRLGGREPLPADRCGIQGDAWDMARNIERAGGEALCETDAPIRDREEFAGRIRRHARVGDIVFFHFPGSQFNEQARASGSGATHVGVVVGRTTNGTREPVIAHMFDGSEYGHGPVAVRYESLADMQSALVNQAAPREPLLYAKALLRPAY